MASTVLAGTPALAADATAAASDSSGAGTQISEVIVTAQKREENLQHVAMSVQAVDAETFSELDAPLPGLREVPAERAVPSVGNTQPEHRLHARRFRWR